MKRGNAWVCAVALGLGINAFSLAADDDSKPAPTGNWFTRLFAHDSAKKQDNDAKKNDASKPSPESPAQVRQKAQAELMRRQEVCDKLRQIALETGDKDLTRKADALDQRAWDVYVQRTGGKGGPSPDERLLDSKLGVDTVQRSGTPSNVSGSVAVKNGDQTAQRKD